MKYPARRAGPVRMASLAALAVVFATPVAPLLAQDTVAETRLRKIESEIRALQRKVFPGGDDRFFEPQITPGAPATTPQIGSPSTTAVTDILTRLDALEGQIAGLTGQVEQNSNRIAQIEARLSSAAPTLAPPVSPAPGASSSPVPTPSPTSPPASQSNLDAMSGGASITPASVTSTPSSARVQAVSAIVKPQTGDPGDDEYSYGFRLWDAKFFPEAQQQLKIFLDKYPSHSRVSWARNLLGRAYLDDGNPREAAKWFLQNYQANKRGDRAPDSLLYLAQSMKQLGDSKRACIALAEFSETYAAEAAGRLGSLYGSVRNGLSCT